MAIPLRVEQVLAHESEGLLSEGNHLRSLIICMAERGRPSKKSVTILWTGLALKASATKKSVLSKPKSVH